MTKDEYATLIFYWHWEPHPERIQEMLSTLATAPWAREPKRALPLAGAVLALEQLEPFQCGFWRRDHPSLYAEIKRTVNMPLDRVEWSDFLLVQWLILRRDDLILQILERAGPHGERCKYTVEMINRACQEHTGFRKAAERLKLPVLVVQ